MLIVREVFTAKPGQAGKLAKLFKRMFAKEAGARVMTDIVGPYNTVVAEMEVESLAEFGRQMEEYKAGKLPEGMDPQLAEEMRGYTELWLTGRREIYELLD